MRVQVRCGRRERGSALLIVFLFAAILAIMLYREMPVRTFEARREKEQLLIDRGHEYVRAIQLYYRKFKPRYPPSIEALESTNQMRFLRHRYNDPFTGKDDWRLIHTNGLALTDSKVNPLKTNPMGGNSQNGTQNSSNSTSGWFTSSNSSSGFFGSSSNQTSSSEPPEVVVQPVPVRPPAIRASGAAASADNASPEDNPEASLLSAVGTGDLSNSQQLEANGTQGQPNSTAGTTQPSSQQPHASGNSVDPMQMVRNMLSTQGPPPAQQTGFGTGAISGGGAMIAGVASKAGGHTIKVINEQTDYSLWEFVYDPTKDTGSGQAGTGGAPGTAGGLQNQSGSNSAGPVQTAQPGSSFFSNTPFGSASGATAANGTRAVPQQ